MLCKAAVMIVFMMLPACYTPSLFAQSEISASKYNQQKPLLVGYINFSPLYFTSEQKAQGILVDITKKIFTGLNLEYRELLMPTKRLFSSLKVGRIDLWCGIKVAELQGQVLTGKVPLHHLTLNLYRSEQSLAIKNKTDLTGKKIILLLGYSYGDWGRYIRNEANKVKFIEVKTHQDALRLLNRGRFQYLLNYQAPMNTMFENTSTAKLQWQTISSLPIMFNVSKAHPSAKLLLAKLDRKLADLIQRGELTIQ